MPKKTEDAQGVDYWRLKAKGNQAAADHADDLADQLYAAEAKLRDLGFPARSEISFVHVIIRVDDYQGKCAIESKITVKAVVPDATTANKEVERLNKLNKSGVRYFCQQARLINKPT